MQICNTKPNDDNDNDKNIILRRYPRKLYANNEYLFPRQCLRDLSIIALVIPLRRIFSIIYLILHLRYRRKLCIIALLSCLHLPPRRLPKLFIISPPTTCAPLHPRLNHV